MKMVYACIAAVVLSGCVTAGEKEALNDAYKMRGDTISVVQSNVTSVVSAYAAKVEDAYAQGLRAAYSSNLKALESAGKLNTETLGQLQAGLERQLTDNHEQLTTEKMLVLQKFDEQFAVIIELDRLTHLLSISGTSMSPEVLDRLIHTAETVVMKDKSEFMSVDGTKIDWSKVMRVISGTHKEPLAPVEPANEEGK